MNNASRFISSLLIVVIAATLGVSEAKGEAQVLNPKFIKAGDLYNQANSEIQRAMSDRWTLLVNEQKELWRRAGEVDRLNAQRQPIPWINDYNNRIINWQNALDQFSAGIQLRSVEYHSRNALEKKSAEEMSAEARKGFDTGGDFHGKLDPAHTVYAGSPVRDADVPKKWNDDKLIIKATKERDVAKKEWAKAEAELKNLPASDPKNALRIETLKEQSDTAKNKVLYENFSIGDRVNALRNEAKSQ